MKKITMGKKSNLSIQEASELFLRKCKVKNLTEESIIFYERKLSRFFDFIDNGKPITSIGTDTIDDYILWLRENTSANDITINSYLRAVRSFCYYCMECGYLPRFKIQLIKAEKRIKETYSDSELERLLEKPDTNTCSFTTYKAWAFENFLLGTGTRISTALNVRISDINFSDGLIIIRKTKNRKQQLIPLSQTLADVLTEYIQIRGGESDDYVFPNVYGEQGTRRTFEQMIEKYNISRNVNKTSAHCFRHTFAKRWILAGGDIFRLQKILGHSDISVTREYVEMFGQDLQLDFEKFNPLDNLKSTSKEKIRMR